MNEYDNKPNNQETEGYPHEPMDHESKIDEYSNEPVNPKNHTKRKLTLSRKNRMIAGVCGGFAEYLNVDVAFLRIAFVALALMSAVFPMWLFYIACWAIIPNQP